MAFRKKCSPEVIVQILTLFTELGSIRETGRRLGLSEVTVRNYVRAQKALCERCTASVPFGQRFCPDCNRKRTDWMRERRRTRREAGLCEACDSRIQRPSIRFCDVHRLAHKMRTDKHAANKLRHVTGHGLPTPGEREKQIRYKYGQAGIEAWHRDQERCVLCGVHYAEKTIHIHHIDGNDTHNVADNLVCLCLRCHRLVHLLSQHPNPHQVLTWFVGHYPQHLIAQLIQRGQSRKPRTTPARNPEQPLLLFAD